MQNAYFELYTYTRYYAILCLAIDINTIQFFFLNDYSTGKSVYL